MSDDANRRLLIREYMHKASESLAAARITLDAGFAALATNRVYYACFYALCALLLQEGIPFAKHSSVRLAMHKTLVKTGRLPTDMGKFYDRAFAERHEADYNALSQFEADVVAKHIGVAHQFVACIAKLLGDDPADSPPTVP